MSDLALTAKDGAPRLHSIPLSSGSFTTPLGAMKILSLSVERELRVDAALPDVSHIPARHIGRLRSVQMIEAEATS